LEKKKKTPHLCSFRHRIRMAGGTPAIREQEARL
jgi:hypothetical protein